ncbi:hypothetical protein PRZ48_014772 [Zasmidium cellare]|uniref:S1-like domain-containing protein n=1 Tax=Zasmidium cellare TaxID=395010 RepID=A0ABR0DZF4_ZASCE|nr:hypothetical protein PRZ48_014772 [Zasmidium cellare]
MPIPKRNIQAVQEETLTPPTTLPPTQKIAQVKTAAGKNLYNCTLPSGEALLCELPSKFRSTVWMKRGSFVVVDLEAASARENKIGGEIVNIVGDVKAWMKASWWPEEFKGGKGGLDSEGEEDEGPRMPPSDDDED